MPSSTRMRASARLALAVLLGACVGGLKAAPHFDVLSIDLAPLIDEAAKSPTRFAVDVPHPVSTATAGEWSTSGDISTWTYSVQIPGAVSMSFHAIRALLPDGASLTVVAGGAAYVYGPEDASGGELWSRIGRGDALAFELKVATADADLVRLEIASFQAGYRGFGPSVRNHPYYEKIRTESFSEAETPSSCAENWTCNATPANEGPGNATVALVIANVGQCSGVLLNDVPGDGAPYVLTARHCENGNADGGSPEAAGGVTVYWNAISACGAPLGSIYDPGIETQYGATTVVEQQDAWLIRLYQLPAVDAYYAGWDATGSAFIGGFTAHHALGSTRQFIGWYGQAAYLTLSAASLGVSFDSTVWGTVNALGAGGAGASGSGVFDESGRLVGTLIRGITAPSSESGVCPVDSPPAPSLSTATSLSTALSGIFASTADPESTTGAATIQSVLDPDGTGTMVLDGQKRPIVVTLRQLRDVYYTGDSAWLDWSTSAFGTPTCTASGGESGDGWAGPVPMTGGKDVTSYDGGDVTYTVTCTDGQTRVGTASVTLHWTLSMPLVNVSRFVVPEYGVPFEVIWSATVRPCTASGGTAGDGWGGSVDPSGHASVTETVVGSVTYSVTCGSGSRTASGETTVDIPAPTASLKADAVTLRVDQTVTLTANWQGGPCTKTGGAEGDGWAGSVPAGNYSSTTVGESTPGTYTYTIACGSGSYIATAQATVTFTDDPPFVSIEASPASASIDGDVITLSWDSNVRPCQASSDGPPGSEPMFQLAAPHFSGETHKSVIGQYVYTVTCGSDDNIAQASTTVNWTGTPSVTLFGLPTGAVAGSAFSVSYDSNVLPCTRTGGTAGDGWAGTSNRTFSSIQVREPSAGTVAFTVTCGSGSLTATDSATVPIVEALQVALTADISGQLTGQPVTLTWTSTTSPCLRTGGYGNDGWSGSSPDASGSITVTEQAPGTYYFYIACGAGSLTGRATEIVTYAAVAAPTLTADKTHVTVGETITLTWASADGSACNANGGGPSDGWRGNRPATGSVELTETFSGDWDFTLLCAGSLPATVRVTVDPAPPPVPLPVVHLTSGRTSVAMNEPFTLDWAVSYATSCTAGGGSGADGWAGDLDETGGSRDIVETTVGIYDYSVTCIGADGRSATDHLGMAVASQAPSASPSAGGGGGGGGGGGAIGPFELALFSILGLLGRRRLAENGCARLPRAVIIRAKAIYAADNSKLR
ncbi:MAG TPA: hypothetical protein VFV10_06035 [Gammaproteobacteria bacterium]|nr:hypothetical protein [Gammaproteobacteria bacterium]